MPLCKRLIARLDVKGAKLIKGIRFEGLKVVGDSCDAAINYYRNGVDEILYIDSVASLYGRNSLEDLVRATCKDIFIPITVGGGINSIEQVKYMFESGADKITINTNAIEDPNIINKAGIIFAN